METGYDANKKKCCECKCEDCFEDEVVEIKTSPVMKVFVTIVLLSSLMCLGLAILYIFGG